MNDQAAVPVTEQPQVAEQPTSDVGPPRCPTCGRRIRHGVVGAETNGSPPVKTKSGVQKRFDQLTREKYDALRQVEDLSGDNAELRNQLQQAKHLLENYRAELEKYRSKFIEIATKEKNARR